MVGVVHDVSQVALELRALVERHGDAAARKQLEALETELGAARATDERLRELNDGLYALASLDFSRPPRPRGDGSLADGALVCLTMLGEELAAWLDERARTEQVLEARVAQRTAELVQASKQAAVGQLAAGFAHEINNPLAVILAFAQGIERRLAFEHSELKHPVSSIIREAQRCKRIVDELTRFSRLDKVAKEPLSPDALVRHAVELLKMRASAQETTIDVELAPKSPPVHGNRSQLEQVLVNLGVNALEALASGGHLRFRVAPSGADRVTIEVTDDGPGLSEQARAHLFEPFFTTKPVGKGLGLGLSVSYEIVQQHGGSLEAAAAGGAKGTTMQVRLPVSAPES
ncbi:MAG: hypothetical protein IPJ65_10775 [Archangiaceae bacterium]|nr:hypothetical protein [Archangiaceae bacterium]